MQKMLDMACASDRCHPDAVTRPMTAVPGSAGFGGGVRDATSDATFDRIDAPLIKLFETGVLKALRLYRELVDLEISRESEYGARWWSSRLVEMYEEAGFVRLDN